MREKNNKFIYYVLGIVFLGAIIFVATKEFKPELTHVESEISIQK